MSAKMIDAEPARAHVRQLVADGMRQSDICRAAQVGASALQILLHGHYTPSRVQQETIHATTAARLLAVQFKAPRVKPGADEELCTPGERFELAGYRVGRCPDCGQIAPLRRQYDRVTLIGHPRRDETGNTA